MDWLILILTVAIGALGIYYLFFRKMREFEKLGIPHIKPWPIFGNIGPMIFKRTTLGDIVDRAYQLNENAEYVGIYNLTKPVIFIRTPEFVKSISVKNFDHFVDRLTLVDAELDPIFGKNLAQLRGEKWKEVRHLLSPAFTSSKLRGMFKLMSNCGKNFADYLAKCASNEPYVLNTKEAFTRLTNDVIATCAFGISVDSMRNPKNDFYVLGRDSTNFEGWRAIKVFFMRSFPTISKLLKLKVVNSVTRKFFEDVIKETIETRDREGITRPDMIQLMMETRDMKIADVPELTIEEMTAQAFVFFFGGFDSTATSICFAAYELAVNEDIQQRLRDEVDEVLANNNGELTYEAINGMEYLDAVVNENLRKYPLAFNLERLCVKRFTLPPTLPDAKPATIEPGDIVWFSSYCIHRDPKYYQDPNKFDPERFLGNRKKNIDPSTYFPFGLGPRICIGNRFALLETKVAIFYLVAKCYLKPSAKTSVPLEFREGEFGMTAKGGFWLQLESRDNDLTKSVVV